MIHFYSFVHFGHGILSYYIFGRFDEKRSDDELLIDPFGNINWSKGFFTDENLGLFITLFSALAFESVENSEAVINRFRENSGKKPRSTPYLKDLVYGRSISVGTMFILE